MALQREIAKVCRNEGRKAIIPWFQRTPEPKSAVRQWYEVNVYPTWFKFFKGPYDRWNYEVRVQFLRSYGVMEDDTIMDRDPIIERAVELLPEDIRTARYRRQLRGVEMSNRKVHLPPEMQNYDPFVPYLAPYFEEAKFQVQEEMELLQYHPWDRRMMSGGLSGAGETNMGSTMTTW